MARPERTIDAETVRRLAQYAGLPLPEDRVQVQLEFLKEQLASLREWEENECLGFRFENGDFSFVRPAVIFRNPWEVPVPINKNRATAPEGRS